MWLKRLGTGRWWWLALVGLILTGGRSYTQEKGFQVRSADVLHVMYIGNDQIRALIGRVSMVQPDAKGDVKIWCDSAFQNIRINVVELFGNVKIVRDSITMTSSRGTYFGNERRALMPRDVRLTRGSMVLTAKSGEYWSTEKRAYFRGDVHVVDSTSSTLSDALTYYEDQERSIAVGNVRLYSADNNMTVFGDSLVHFENTKYTMVPKSPRLMQIDTVSPGTLDTLLIVGTFMESFQDTVQRFITRGRVEMARRDFAARCGEAIYYFKKDRIVMRQQPVVWHEENQVTGDSIVITTSERKLQSVYVRGRAMAISRADSVRTARFDQLSAREITLHFRNSKLVEIDADKTATSLYYLFDGAAPNGVNRSSGDRIVMEFLDGKVHRIKIIGGVEGKYFPERMIAKHEREYNLDGFRWITDRPRRRLLGIVHESHE
jgi:lipopolysaccharide export system protein LptA